MNGKGCWRNIVFVERLWKSVKHEDIYLHGYDTVSVARKSDPVLRFPQPAPAAFDS
jgi:putative transposase